MSNYSLEYWGTRINFFYTVYPSELSENDRTTYIAAMGEVIDLDTVVVTASGNINVSPRFL